MRLLRYGLTLLLLLWSGMGYLMPIVTGLSSAGSANQGPEPHQCRLWAMVAPSLPEAVVMEHLVNGSSSLKALGAYNHNGWGLACYNSAEPAIARGQSPASSDSAFDLAARQLAGSGSRVGVGHVRLASSGAVDIPDPHPFVRFKGGKWWAYGQNGGLSENSLRELIGPEYLEQNPPTVGDNWSDPRVVESDLYMLYFLKCTEENGWNATLGIAKAVKDITQKASGTMNFFLTNGETVWSFRMGNTLYYCYSQSPTQYSAVASQPSTSDTQGWIQLNDYDLIILTQDSPPIIVESVMAIPEHTSVTWIFSFVVATLTFAVICRKKLNTKQETCQQAANGYVGSVLCRLGMLPILSTRTGKSVMEVMT